MEWTLYDLADLRMQGSWMVLTHPMPEGYQGYRYAGTSAQTDFGMNLAILCIKDMKKQIEILNNPV